MSRTILGALAALAVVIVAGLAWMFTGPGSDAPAPASAPGLPMELSELDMPVGAADAPITVIEYSSFTCPHCKNFHLEVLPQIKANYIDTGKVRFAFREAYFDRYGLIASMIARCGGPLRYHAMVDLIFEKQPEWVRGNPDEVVASLRKIGKVGGLGDAALDTCLSDTQTGDALLAWYRANIETHAIEATPSFVINGVKYSNMSYDAFAEVFDTALAK